MRVHLNNSYTFVHPSSCVCGRVNVLYPVTMKATYVLLCVGLVVLPATICQSPAERDSYTVSNCDNFSLFFCLPLQSSFMLEHEHVYLPSYVTQYIQCGIVYYQTSVCIRSHVPVNKSVWVWLLHNKVCFLCQECTDGYEWDVQTQLCRGGWKVMCQRKRERDDEKVIHFSSNYLVG